MCIHDKENVTHFWSFLYCRAVSTKKGENSVPTNGVKSTKDDDGWEVATGNDFELSSESIIPCSYPHERSRAPSRPRGSNHEAVETLLLEQMKVVQKIRLKNSFSLPTDFRNDRKKDAVPKYTILKRNAKTDNDCKVDDARKVFQTTEIRLSSTAKANRCDSLISDSHNCKLEKTKKSNSNRCTNQSVGIISYKSVQGKSTKYKENENPVGFPFSSKKTSRVFSSPSADLKIRTKKQSKTKPIVEEKSYTSKNTFGLNKEKYLSDSKKQNDPKWSFQSTDTGKGKRLLIILAKICFSILFFIISRLRWTEGGET